MITIDNQPLEFDEGREPYRSDSIEQQTLNLMLRSEECYRYESLTELEFEMKLRKEIVNASGGLAESNLSFAVFRNSRCNTRYWRRTNQGGFVLRNGVRPSEAINDIYANSSLYATECATAMVIIYYKALLEVYGPEKFDRAFPTIYLMNWHNLDPLLRESGALVMTNDYLPGDRRYFANPDVHPMTPQWQGENVIDLNGELYYGHGIGIKSAEQIIYTLNQTRKPNAKRPAYLMDKVGRLNFNKLYNVYQQG